MIVVLGYGTVVHIVQLATGGPRPYAWAPSWLAAYFTALTVLDPLAAGLLAARRVQGLYLTIVVFSTDALANGYAVYWLGSASGTAAVSQAVVTLFAVGSIIAAPVIRPHLARTASAAGEAGR